MSCRESDQVSELLWRVLLCVLLMGLFGCQELTQMMTPSDEVAIGSRDARARPARAAASRYTPGSLSYRRKHGEPLILLDPGHGGGDLGAPGSGEMVEKEIVLDVAFRLERLLRDNLGAAVYLTRRTDTELELGDRTKMANDLAPDIFVSLHVNAAKRKVAHGLEVYYLDNTNDQASIKLAQRENTSGSVERPPGDLEFMLSDLIQNAKMSDSIVLANLVGRTLYRYLKPNWPGIKYLGVKKAPFYVLVGAHMPCVLVEMFFISNPADAAKLTQAEFRSQMAFGLYLGIREFLQRRGR